MTAILIISSTSMLEKGSFRKVGLLVIGAIAALTLMLEWAAVSKTKFRGGGGGGEPTSDILGTITTTCKEATAAGYSVKCCAEADSNINSMTLSAVSLDTPPESEVWTEVSSATARFVDIPQPVPRPVAGKGSNKTAPRLHVLVTGGAGYIGSHCALRLLEDGHAVTIVDNLSRGNRGAIRELEKVAAPDQVRGK